jgi:protein involved in polysaccharide export with SLBB domain
MTMLTARRFRGLLVAVTLGAFLGSTLAWPSGAALAQNRMFPLNVAPFGGGGGNNQDGRNQTSPYGTMLPATPPQQFAPPNAQYAVPLPTPFGAAQPGFPQANVPGVPMPGPNGLPGGVLPRNNRETRDAILQQFRQQQQPTQSVMPVVPPVCQPGTWAAPRPPQPAPPGLYPGQQQPLVTQTANQYPLNPMPLPGSLLATPLVPMTASGTAAMPGQTMPSAPSLLPTPAPAPTPGPVSPSPQMTPQGPVYGEPWREEISRIEDAYQPEVIQQFLVPSRTVPLQRTAGPVPTGSPVLGSTSSSFDVPLRQYGYSMFATTVSSFAPVDDVPVGPDYVVGPGDDLTVSVWGAVDSTIALTVDRNGSVVLPKVGDLKVWGLTFAQTDRLIREQLARYFRGFNTSVTMGRLRTVRVHVVGEVCQPGVYTLSSLSTVTNALFSAGGPTKLGSLRDIRVLRNHHTVGTLDLYDFLQRGDRTSDFRVESGDTIFVPTIGEVAAVSGEVKRPAIYELRAETRLSDLIDMAGGVTPTSYLRRVQIVRAMPNAERVTVDVDLATFLLKGDFAANPIVRAGDLVLVHRSDSRVYNTVALAGAVKYAGPYELKPMMRVSQLVPRELVTPEAFPERVEIARRRPDQSVEVVPINLKKAWEGDLEHDVLLRPLDEVTVRSEVRDTRTVTLSGEVVRPGTYVITEGERLSSVVERAGGFTDRAFVKGAVFTRAALRQSEQEQINHFLKQQEQRILQSASTTVVGAEKEEVAFQQLSIQTRRELIKALASRMAAGRMVVRVDSLARLKGSADDVILVDGDALHVPDPPSSVLVLGAVRTSTSVRYQDGESVEYYVGRVGGLSKEADEKEVHIIKADGSAVASFSKVRKVEAGDTIVVPPKDEVKIRSLPIARDVMQTLGSVLLSFAALLRIF